MKLKSYFAGSVEAAVSQASKELGPDALLVYSREAPPEARYLGAYEVVFSLPTAAEQSPVTQPAAGDRVPAAAAAGVAGNGRFEQQTHSRLTEEVLVLRKQMERMTSTLSRMQPVVGNGEWISGPMVEMLDELLGAGISHELVQQVAISLQKNLSAGAGAAELPELRKALRRELETVFSVDARLGSEAGGPRVVALVGPPGSGKTTTLVKLAVAYGLKSRRPVQLLSADMWRIGGAEQLRSYAAILGVGFQALETPRALTQALEEHRHKDLILIDTPGHSQRDMDAAEDLAHVLKSHPEVDTHLTLSASMKSADLKNAVDRHERFGPAKLLFTRLDETASLGTVLNESARTGKPISFMTDGQRIPEDMREATKDRILDLILGAQSEQAESPALDSDPSLTPEAMKKQLVDSHAAAA